MSELSALLRLAGPIVLSQLGQMLLGTVDTLLAGHLSVRALGAVTLGSLFQIATMVPAYGVVMGLDPLVSQAYGAGRAEDASRALQRGILIALALSVPVGASWLYTEEILLALGQSPALCAQAELYTRAQWFAAPGFLLYGAQATYLQARGIVRPGVIVMFLANVFNAVAAWGLIFGKIGLPAYGVWGAGLATGLTRVFMALSMVGLIWGLKLAPGGLRPSRESLRDGRGLWAQAALGIPVGMTLALELWAFQLGTLLAGRIGNTELGAHSIAINLASLAFMVPLGISISASARVGTWIGSLEPERAQHAAQTALKLGGGFATLSAFTFVVAGPALCALYSQDPGVLAAAVSIMPVAAAFQLMDGLQCVSAGVLRGMGRTRPTAVLNFIGYFVIGLPLGAHLGLSTSLGLVGVWLGYAAGLTVVASGLVGWVLLRGPRTVRPLA